MVNKKPCGFLLIGLLLPALSGCTHVISSELRKEAKRGLELPVVLSDPAAHVGSTVIWGGVIVESALPRPAETQLIVMETPLDFEGRPARKEYSRGRFIARGKDLDSKAYRKGKKVTLAGDIVGQQTQLLGESQYTYPVVEIREIYLWEEPTYGRYPPEYYRDWYQRWPSRGSYPWYYFNYPFRHPRSRSMHGR